MHHIFVGEHLPGPDRLHRDAKVVASRERIGERLACRILDVRND